jgi:hypothetical protein
MSILDMPNIYEATFYGEPLSLPVRPTTLNTDGHFWTVGDWRLVLPKVIVHRAPDVQHMLGDIEAWTGWSKRQLAGVLGTSHTTVRNAAAGRPLLAARSGDLRRRVANTHNLVGRVYVLGGRDAQETAHILEAPQGENPPAIDALRATNYERAYIAALDVLRPRPTGMLVGNRPRRSGATMPLHD